MRIAIIANPTAGRGCTRRDASTFVDAVAHRGIAASLHWTRAPRHARHLGRELSVSHDAVCAFGGDGTVHEVANGIAGTNTPMVVVPTGSGNDFARLLPCPRSPDSFARVVREGVGARVDVIDCGFALCVNSIGLGFEALVTRESRTIRRLRGLPLYLLALVKALRVFRAPNLTIVADGDRRLSGPRLLVSVGNGVSAGGGFFLTPEARPDDGWMDVCAVASMGRMKMLRLLPLVLRGGRHTTRPEVTMLRARRIEIDSADPLPLHVDGEYTGEARRSVTLTLLDRRLPVLCRSGRPALLTRPLERLL